MNGAIRYTGDGLRQAWLIPFPYGSPSDFRVELSQGAETTILSHENGDFRVIDRCVVYPLPAGATLALTLISPIYQAQALNEARVRAAILAGQNEERAAFHAQAAAQIAEDAASHCQEACEKFSDNVGQAAADCVSSVTQKAKEAESLINSIAEEAVAKAALAGREAVEKAGNPGLSAAPSVETLEPATRGFFVINPYLAAQMGAQGMWAAKSAGDIAWDGFFLIIPECPGHAGYGGWTPSGFPDNTPGEGNAGEGNAGNAGEVNAGEGAGGAAAADGEWWLPCDHKHP